MECTENRKKFDKKLNTHKHARKNTKHISMQKFTRQEKFRQKKLTSPRCMIID